MIVRVVLIMMVTPIYDHSNHDYDSDSNDYDSDDGYDCFLFGE